MFGTGTVEEQTTLVAKPAKEIVMGDPPTQVVYWTVMTDGLTLVTRYFFWTQGVTLGVKVGVGVNVGQGTFNRVVLNVSSKQPTDGLVVKPITHSNVVPIGSSLSISK